MLRDDTSPHRPHCAFDESGSRDGSLKALPPFCANCACVDECRFRAGIISENCPVTGSDLKSLQGSGLSDRFYSWRGVSGARHICRIVPIEMESVIGQFSKVLAIGARRSGQQVRPVCFILFDEFNAPAGYRMRRHAASHGCSEWHLYFEDQPQKVRDLTLSLGLA